MTVANIIGLLVFQPEKDGISRHPIIFEFACHFTV